MISGISKKVIFFSFLFINFIQPSKSAELSKINKDTNNQNVNIILPNLHNLDIKPNSQDNSLSDDLDDSNYYVKIVKKIILRIYLLFQI